MLNTPTPLPSISPIRTTCPSTSSLRSRSSPPAPFPRTGQIQIASADDSLHATLSVAAGTLVLQNPHTLLGTLDPLKSFGTSAFGPLRLRAVAPDGTPGDWLPLVHLVRLPTLTDIHCSSDQAAPCTLTGTSLYLVDSVAIDPDFITSTTVPGDLSVLRLIFPAPRRRASTCGSEDDDPTATNTVTLPILPPAPSCSANSPKHKRRRRAFHSLPPRTS